MAIYTKYNKIDSIEDYLDTLIKDEQEVKIYAEITRIKAYREIQEEPKWIIEGLSGLFGDEFPPFDLKLDDSDFEEHFEIDNTYDEIVKKSKAKVYKLRLPLLHTIRIKNNIQYIDSKGFKVKNKIGDFLIIESPQKIYTKKAEQILYMYSECDKNGVFLDKKLNNQLKKEKIKLL